MQCKQSVCERLLHKSFGSRRCRHNQVYWSGEPYQAFGVGAASYINRHRFSRPRSMSHYKKWVAELVSKNGLPPGSFFSVYLYFQKASRSLHTSLTCMQLQKCPRLRTPPENVFLIAVAERKNQNQQRRYSMTQGFGNGQWHSVCRSW